MTSNSIYGAHYNSNSEPNQHSLRNSARLTPLKSYKERKPNNHDAIAHNLELSQNYDNIAEYKRKVFAQVGIVTRIP